ncbi:MAG TPA: D-aminoacylase [Vicinamibacterales bacterium]|nr:D-aminoacylase [Vicinamibacterales bacterium]
MTSQRIPAIAFLAVLVCACGTSSAQRFDLIVRGGTLIDGSGQPPQRADLGIVGDRIARIGDLASESGGRVIDATGLIVAPGFIDVQGQSGTTLLADGNGESHLRQGITSEIIGEGGSPAFWTAGSDDGESLAPFGLTFDWKDFNGYFEKLRQRGTTINVGTFVPATMVRRAIVGMDNRPPTAEELSRMEAMVDQAMRDGAFGLSSALIYVPGTFAKTDELLALAKVAAKHKGIYISHIRGESFNLFNAIDEAIGIGRDAGLPVVIYHLKVGAKANWGRMNEVVAAIEKANAGGVRVSATMYPYTAGGTGLAATLPLWVQEGGREKMLGRLKDPAMRAKARKEIETKLDGWENLLMAATFDGIQVASVPREFDQSIVGKRISEIAAQRKADPWDVFFALLIDTGGRVGALFHMMSEEDVKAGLRATFVTIGTDSSALRSEGVLAQGSPHPRSYGTFPRVLGKYARDDKIFEMHTAVHRMTGAAATQMGLRDRGFLRERYLADVVVFNPKTVKDTATYERPHQYPTGIDYVIVNGVTVLDQKGLTGARPGRPLYGPARQP